MACESDGFTQGAAAEGKSTWPDCVIPILQGQASPALPKPLPPINPKLKAACLAVQPQLRKPQSEPASRTPAHSGNPSISAAAYGIFVWPTNWMVKNGDFDKALAVPGVTGMGVPLTWAEISPTIKTYDFTTMDRQLAVARSHHLAVELSVMAGKGNPEWLFEKPPLGLGLQRLDFAVNYHGGSEPCQKVSMPPPWDPGYQVAFADMLAHLSRHLRETGYDRDVAVIKLTGIQTLTEELGLPGATPAESRSSCVTDSPRVWAAAGYRPSVVARAMGGIASSYQRYFPNTLITLPIIVEFAFPPIGEDGHPVPRQKALGINDHLLEVLVAVAARALPGHLVVQDCFLIDDEPADQRTVGLARSNTTPIAWQTNIWFGKNGKGAACAGSGGGFLQKMQNAIPCTESSYLRMLHNGMYPQGGSGPNKNSLFIEVFPSDVLDFPRAITAAHDEWKR
jgi:hypothetical protein